MPNSTQIARRSSAMISSIPLPPTPVSIAADLDELRKAVDQFTVLGQR